MTIFANDNPSLQADRHANAMKFVLEELKVCCAAVKRGERNMNERFAMVAERAQALVAISLDRDQKNTIKVVKMSKAIIAEKSFNVSREGLFLLIKRKTSFIPDF